MSTLAPPFQSPALDVQYDAVVLTTMPAEVARLRLARRQVHLLINLTLLSLVCLSFASGWVASMLGLTEFGLHKYSSIALLLFAGSHVFLHLRSLSTQLRNVLGHSRRKPNLVSRSD